MIRLLIIVIVFLFLAYLLNEYFSKGKKEKFHFKLKPKYFLLIPAGLGIVMLLKYFPKIVAKFASIQGLIAPFIGIIKNLITFI